MFSQIITTGLLALSVGAPTRHNANANSNLISGSYNLNETFSYDDLHELYEDLGDFSFACDFNRYTGGAFSHECLLSYNGNPIGYVYSITFELYYGVDSPILECEFDFCTGQYSGGTYGTAILNITIDENVVDLSDLIASLRDTIFCVNKSFFINDDESRIFNFLWSREDNSYVTTYTGFYNFNNSLSNFNNKKFIAFGTVSFNGNLYYDIYNNTYNFDNASLRFSFFDYEHQTYSSVVYTLPLSSYNDVNYNNIYLTNCKMSLNDYNNLSSIGAFAYSPDHSYDNATFHDLLFGVMDSPIYFLSRLMSFELFGVNMFVAFTGLLTLCVVLVLIRKF